MRGCAAHGYALPRVKVVWLLNLRWLGEPRAMRYVNVRGSSSSIADSA